jgi:acetyltransferase-like isoleucine patch superfamily enzyme
LPTFFLKKKLLQLCGFYIGKQSYIHRGVRFFSIKKLHIGDNSVINPNCYLDNRRGIYIGNNVVISHQTKIYTLGHDYNHIEYITVGAQVKIEDYAIIFSNVIIMPGVTINRGAVVLSGSVIAKDVAEMEVVGGNPARTIKKRKNLHTDKKPYGFWFTI